MKRHPTTLFDDELRPLEFEPPRARTTDPGTSWRAARGVDGNTDRRRAYDALAAAPEGLTDFELGDRIGRQQTSAGKRRLELQRAGLVEWSGEVRPSPSGAHARVWRLVLSRRPVERTPPL